MDINVIKAFLKNVEITSVEIDISFIQKNKMVEYKPQISLDVKIKLIKLFYDFIDKRIKNNILVEYNPVGVLDNEIEYLDLNKIKESEYSKNFFTERVNKIEGDFHPEKIDFYEVTIRKDKQIIKIYRQFQKLKNLRKGIITRVFDNQLNVLEENFIGIDGTIDLVFWNDNIIAFNHIALERILNFKDAFQEHTKKAMHKIRDKDLIINMDQFENDCMRDSRLLKRFTNIMSKDRLPLFFQNYDKVKHIVKEELQLTIDFDENDKIIYDDKKQLFHIVHLMSDSYFRSLLADRIGVAEREGNINDEL